MPRTIADILLFRTDQSPFLVHLTRGTARVQARSVLEAILGQRELLPGNPNISDARFGGRTDHLDDATKTRFFSAVCFSETPISEVHCLLDIANRNVNLEPYGLAFLKDTLAQRGVSPVLYLNNTQDAMAPVVASLFERIAAEPNVAEELLPLVSLFGRKLTAPGAARAQHGQVDWRWEREWRLPACKAPLRFEFADVFVGFCLHDEIDELEARFPDIRFIDPQRTMKWYASKLIERRQALNLRHSVV